MPCAISKGFVQLRTFPCSCAACAYVYELTAGSLVAVQSHVDECVAGYGYWLARVRGKAFTPRPLFRGQKRPRDHLCSTNLVPVQWYSLRQHGAVEDSYVLEVHEESACLPVEHIIMLAGLEFHGSDSSRGLFFVSAEMHAEILAAAR